MQYLVKFTHTTPVVEGHPGAWIDGYKTAAAAKQAVRKVEEHRLKHGSAPWTAEYLGSEAKRYGRK